MISCNFVPTAAGPVRYAQAGAGPDVVLVHGAMTSVEEMVLGPFDGLAARFRVTAFDRPGHGETPRRRLQGAPRQQASQLLDAINALGLERAVVVGQSFGAALALELALMVPERIIGVLVISPIAFAEVRLETLIYGPRLIPGLGDAIAYGLGRVLDAALLPILWHAMFAPQLMPARFATHYPFLEGSGPSQMQRLGEEAVQALPDLTAASARYRNLRPPLSILVGMADWVTPPPTHAIRLAMAAPKAKIQFLPGLGHMLHHFAIDTVVEAALRLLAAGSSAATSALVANDLADRSQERERHPTPTTRKGQSSQLPPAGISKEGTPLARAATREIPS